jgi:hypothetical protein
MIENFDTTDLDKAIAVYGIKTCGFGIEDDFAHLGSDGGRFSRQTCPAASGSASCHE